MKYFGDYHYRVLNIGTVVFNGGVDSSGQLFPFHLFRHLNNMPIHSLYIVSVDCFNQNYGNLQSQFKGNFPTQFIWTASILRAIYIICTNHFTRIIFSINYSMPFSLSRKEKRFISRMDETKYKYPHFYSINK